MLGKPRILPLFPSSFSFLGGKEVKCEACRAFYLFFAMSLINSIKYEHSCKILYLTLIFQSILRATSLYLRKQKSFHISYIQGWHQEKAMHTRKSWKQSTTNSMRKVKSAPGQLL